MGKARDMARKKKHDDALMNRFFLKTFETRGVATWSDLNHDLLFSVMMRLTGFVDFLAFGGVCKSWRSFALINRNKFIVSRPPMSISFSTDSTKCYLEDFEGRKFSTILPHSAGRTCIGVTCGYLILVCCWDIWLVNPITSHEIHFPNVPDSIICCPGTEQMDLRGVLVFSPSISEFIFVLLKSFCAPILCFSIAGTHEWTKVYGFLTGGLHFFNGKIYNLPFRYQEELYELRLYPKPRLATLETERFPKPHSAIPEIVKSGENLYAVYWVSEHPYNYIHKLDFGEMKWVSRENTGEKYVFFEYSELKDFATITLQEVWADLRPQFERYVLTKRTGKDMVFKANMWYFFHDCLNANILDE